MNKFLFHFSLSLSLHSELTFSPCQSIMQRSAFDHPITIRRDGSECKTRKDESETVAGSNPSSLRYFRLPDLLQSSHGHSVARKLIDFESDPNHTKASRFDQTHSDQGCYVRAALHSDHRYLAVTGVMRFKISSLPSDAAHWTISPGMVHYNHLPCMASEISFCPGLRY
jgi:hypothetical protein